MIEENEKIAQKFELIAGLLESQQENPYRVQAYRNAADCHRPGYTAPVMVGWSAPVAVGRCAPPMVARCGPPAVG